MAEVTGRVSVDWFGVSLLIIPLGSYRKLP